MKLFWNTFNGMFIGTIVIVTIVSFICAIVATNMTFKYRIKESFIKEFFDFVWGIVSWIFGVGLVGVICVFLFGVIISVITFGILDGVALLFEILVYAKKIVNVIWWIIVFISVVTNISVSFEDYPYSSDLSHDYPNSSGSSYNYPKVTTYTVDDPYDPYRILPVEYKARDEGDRVVVTKYDPHNPKIFDDRYVIKKK